MVSYEEHMADTANYTHHYLQFDNSALAPKSRVISTKWLPLITHLHNLESYITFSQCCDSEREWLVKLC